MNSPEDQLWQELNEASELEAAADIIELEELEIAQRGGSALKAVMLGGKPDAIRIYRSID